MRIASSNNWLECNKQHLMAAVGLVREELKRYKSSFDNQSSENKSVRAEYSSAQKKLKQASENMPAPPALDILTELFGLSPFERNILLMCAGVELDSSLAILCASIQGNQMRPYPTFSLALAALSDAHWSALTPGAPLRYWRLVEISAGVILTSSPIRIDERVLHYLTGTSYMDERLAGIVEPLFTDVNLVPSHYNIAERMKKTWLKRAGKSIPPVIQLCGDEITGKRAIALETCITLGLNLNKMNVHVLPNNTGELDALIRLWEREAALSACALFLECDEMNTLDTSRLNALNQFCENIKGALIISCRKQSLSLHRPMIVLDVNKPETKEQYSVWKKALDTKADKLDDLLERIISQFNLNVKTIRTASSEVLENLPTKNKKQDKPSNDLGETLWDVCRKHTRPALDNLAQRIRSSATWEDLVLPSLQKQTLREIALHMRQRRKVYEEWGFAAKFDRGLGISVLFTGESGTGKTMASEVLANELNLDLYRIDLSQVVSKYIGETEKNLKQVFDAAEHGGAILLFDEADSLFGKRSEVKDSHDRYANIEVSYLLQRMETYRGLAILTTNMKSALDNAFLRRIRFIVHFPFPDVTQRAEIWRRIFPSDTPTEELDTDKLSRLNITGGNIRNIALSAAFLAADRGEPVSMIHLLWAARSEYTKLEKPLSSTEIGEWR